MTTAKAPPVESLDVAAYTIPTRCGGFTGFAQGAAVADAHGIDVSAHCAPQLSVRACAAAWHLRHLEYFHDHVRIEAMLFAGALEPEPGGVLRPDRSRVGPGLAFKSADAERFAAHPWSPQRGESQ